MFADYVWEQIVMLVIIVACLIIAALAFALAAMYRHKNMVIRNLQRQVIRQQEQIALCRFGANMWNMVSAKFHVVPADYGGCVDISAVAAPSSGPVERYALGRVPVHLLPKLYAAIGKALDAEVHKDL